jgi:hypothetical protein
MIKLPGEGAWQGIPLEPGVLAIGQPDLADQLFRALQLKGPLPNELDRHYQLGINALDLMDPEYRYLRREALAYGGALVAAGGAGNFGFGSLRGAADKVIVLDEVHLANPTAATIQFQCGVQGQFPSGVGAVAGTPRDARLGVASVLAGAVRMGVDPAPVAPFQPYTIAVQAGDTYCLRVAAVLASASQFWSAIAQTANVAVGVTFFWRERAMLTSEQ